MEMSSYIDHTLLDPEATKEAVEALCKEAITYGFATVCMHPYWVPFAKELLETSSVGITSVIGFPLGMTTKKVKAMETLDCIEKGATEIDMVINIGALKSKQYEEVEDDIREVVEAAKGKTVKVIIETGTLTEEEKVKACELSMSAGATFVKTSTGFGKGQATISDVQLMKATVGDRLQVKASGGIRSAEAAEAMIKAGASRLGTSAGLAIANNTSSARNY